MYSYIFLLGLYYVLRIDTRPKSMQLLRQCPAKALKP